MERGTTTANPAFSHPYGRSTDNSNNHVFTPTMGTSMFIDDTQKLRDEISAIAFKEFLHGEEIKRSIRDGIPTEPLAKAIAILSFDFVDAFMRERYERQCNAAAGINFNELAKKNSNV